MGKLELWDQMATLYINGFNSPWSDQMWMFFSNKYVWFPFYAIIAGCLIWRLGWKRGLIAIFTIALTILAVDQSCNLVKDTVARLRPCNDPDVIAQGLHILESPSQRYKYGFFSAHSANAFAFALGSILAFRKGLNHKAHIAYSSIIMVWAFMVAVSRIFVGKHFLGDVVVGALVSFTLCWLIFKAVEWIGSKIARKCGQSN